MTITRQIHPAGFPIYSLTSGEDEVVISAFGAQILSWKKSSVAIVFENHDHAVEDGKTAYRGGAPICFPYFAKGTLMPLGTTLSPMHGGARTMAWEEVDSSEALVLKTVQPTAEGYGPSSLSCELRFSLSDSLSIQATIKNAGDLEAPFQLAVHTYWATNQPAEALVAGLGNRYLDNLLGLIEQTEPDSSEAHPTPVDRVYLDAAASQTLTTENYKLKIITEGCDGAVLWNPGLNHGMKDLASPDFICVESGQIAKGKNLAPAEERKILITYFAELGKG